MGHHLPPPPKFQQSSGAEQGDRSHSPTAKQLFASLHGSPEALCLSFPIGSGLALGWPTHPTPGLAARAVPSAGRGLQGLGYMPGMLGMALVSYCSCCVACCPSHPAQYSTPARHRGTALLHGTVMHCASVSPGLLFLLLISGHCG